jgi:hypothetical protein
MPEPLFNSETRAIDRRAFNHWKRYDLTQYIIKHWRTLKKDLDGKLRVSVGTEDNVQLPAVKMMEMEMKKLHAGIEFAYYPGTHFTVATPQYGKDQAAFLVKKYLEWLAKDGITDSK